MNAHSMAASSAATSSTAASRSDIVRDTAIGSLRLSRCSWDRPIDVQAEPAGHHLELAFMPRPRSQACFPERWGAQRFEPIGALFLMPAGVLIHARSECRQQASIVCTLQPEALRQWFDGEIEWTDRRLSGSLAMSSRPLQLLLHRLGEEVGNPGFATDALIETMVAQIALELSRHWQGAETPPVSGGLAAWQLRAIDERIDEVGAPPTLAELAILCGLSARHLARGFRASRGCSIGEHITEQRMGQARRMLASDRPVKAIAHAMGFASASNFSVAFRRATGASPGQYRREHSHGSH